jgi:2-polyprenyl-3-methyl-5-hydroxy-6-metoxy-1,4-benzoquinol methylase
MSRLDAVAQRVQAAFAGAPRSERLHVAGRLRTCPVAQIAGATPDTGTVLDFGCGHGAISLYLALDGPNRRITGVDVDSQKLVHAQGAARAVDATVEFRAVDVGYRPSGQWDAITIIDVLYLLGEEVAMEVLDAAADALAPGGVLVVKELDVRPWWKYWPAVAQELLAVKLLRITAGGRVKLLPPERIGARLERMGLTVEQRPCHRGRLHPHHMIIGRKPTQE